MNEQEVNDLRWQPVGTFRVETTTLSESELYVVEGLSDAESEEIANPV